MNCKHAANLLSPLLESELSPMEAAQVQAHLNTCPACATEFADLQRTALLLQTDAALPLPPLPHLYSDFQQRLVTQLAPAPFWGRRTSRISPAWLLPRLAVCVAGAIVAGNALQHRFFPYSRMERSLLAAASDLARHSESPMYVNEIRRFYTPDGQARTNFFYTWWDKGYSYERILQQMPRQSGKSAADSEDYKLSFRYYTPGGTIISWEAGNLNKRAYLEWIPTDPLGKSNTNYAIQYDADRYAGWLEQIAKSGKTAVGQAEQAEETNGKEPLRRLKIGDLKAGLKRTDGPNTGIDAPDALTLWFDSSGRIRHCEELQREQYGTPLNEDTLIEYPETPHPYIAAPDVPTYCPMLAGAKRLAKNAPVPPERLIKPVWLTMSAKEKEEVTHAIKIFAEMWRAHNAVRLREVVDTDYLLEMTRPDKRAGLTSESIWKRVWLDRLRQQPPWQYFAINVDFAFEAEPRLLDAVPLDVNEWTLENTLPGLNALAWINARRADNSDYKIGARLYLIKRPTGWKVYQFGLLRTGDAVTP